jgi:tetratricopeptide (TPR) repeat protein
MYFIDRANSLHYMGEYPRAIADLTQALKLEPTADIYQRRGDYYLATGAVENAISDYSEAIKLAPNRQQFLHARAKAYDAKHETALAEADREAAKRVEFSRFQALTQQPHASKSVSEKR